MSARINFEISSANPSIELQAHYNKQIIFWLSACALTIYGMILLGGVTRLTGSGLSMVEWRPITGVIPPLNTNDWEILFTKYQQFPEYKLINNAMHNKIEITVVSENTLVSAMNLVSLTYVGRL